MSRARHLVAAAVLAAAAGPLVWASTSTTAEAATCADAGGVSVVVDFKGLGGGAQSVCDPGGAGQKAASLFTDNGYQLTYAQRTPGFVCRVEGLPTSDPCVNTSPANAYWGVWWSDGKTGRWSYSTQGVGSLTIPSGGSVALAWDGVDGQAAPGVAPPKKSAAPTAAPTPSASPTVKPTPTPTQAPTSKPTPTPTTAPTPTAAPTASPTPTSLASPAPSPLPAGSPPPTAVATPTPSSSETPSASATEEAEPAPSSAAADPDDGGLPPWVPVVVILTLFAGAAGFVVRRRRA